MLKNNTIKEIEEYLKINYLTLEQLEIATNVDVKQIQVFIKKAIIPKHSHQVTYHVKFHSDIFGDRVLEEELFYYHPSLIQWIIKAKDYSHIVNIIDIASKMKMDFTQSLRQALLETDGAQHIFNDCFHNDDNLLDAGIEKLMVENWPYIMDGTYGVCLKVISAKNMIDKLMSVSILEKWLLSEDKGSNDQYLKVLQAAELYDRVASVFGPHELKKSTRDRLFNKFKRESSGISK